MTINSLKERLLSLKKIELNPLVLGASVIFLSLGSFYAGNAFSGTLPNPFVKSVNKVDFSSLNSIYALMQRNFDGKIDDQKALGRRQGRPRSRRRRPLHRLYGRQISQAARR